MSTHAVFIADNDGMNLLFPLMVNHLKNNGDDGLHMSLLYVSEDNTFIFKEELSVLATRYPTVFIIHYKDIFRQELLEVIINSNTRKNIQFHIAMPEPYRESIAQRLVFLGIETSDITIYP